MEGDGSNLPSLPENEYSEFLAENVEDFQEFIEEGFEAIDQDENFNEMTDESYVQKTSYMKSHLLDLSDIHNALACEFLNLIIDVRTHCPPLLQNQHHGSSDLTSGFNVLLQPGGGGGFYFSKNEGSSHSGTESSTSSVNNRAVGLLLLEGDRSVYRLYKLPEHDYFKCVAENVDAFFQFMYESHKAIEQDEDFNELTPESYAQKKLRVKSHLVELSLIHNALADQFGNLIKKVGKHCPSMLQNQRLSSSDSTAPQVICQPVNKLEVAPVNDDTLKVEETKDSDSGSKSSMSSVNKPVVPQANDDALKVEETKDHKVLLEKISNLVSLKQKLQSLTVELDGKTDQLDIVWAKRRSQEILIHQLKTDLNSVQFDKISKLTDEAKLKLVELDREVHRQREATSKGE